MNKKIHLPDDIKNGILLEIIEFTSITQYNMILVTGATGLLGSDLLAKLVLKGHTVKATRRGSSNMSLLEKTFRRYNVPPGKITWAEADITDYFSLLEAMKDAEQVYHVAAVVSFNPQAASHMISVNVSGTANVVNAALECGIKKLCHVSSTAALGRTEESKMMDEESHWQNSKYNSNYAISKYGAEREVWRGIEEGLNAVIVNPSVIIGPGDWKTDSSRIIGQVWKGLRFYPGGGNAFADVRDVTDVMIKLMEGTYNKNRYLVMSANKSYREVFNLIADAFGKKKPSLKINGFMSAAAWRAEWLRSKITGAAPVVTKEILRSSGRNYMYSNIKIKTELKHDFIPLEETIKDTCKIFLEELDK
jgi:nucleoside-diphosphate-sugar epimerase